MGFGSILSGLFGGGDKVNAPATPSYYTDPNYSSTQTYLKNYAEKGLQGDLPAWYKAIGEVMPENLITGQSNSLTSDILGKSMERAALSGTGRGGALSADTMNALGNQSANLRYSDYLRAMTGRSDLLNTMLGVETGVRDSAYNNQTATNSFDQWKYGADLAQEQNRAAQSNALSTQRWSSAGGAIDEIIGASTGTSGLSSLSGSTGTGNLSYSGVGTSPSNLSPYSTSNLNFGKTSNSNTIATILKMLAGS